MNKITVGLFTDSFYPMIDGVGMVVDNYARRLLKYCNVYVIAPYYGECDDSKYPYEVIRSKAVKTYVSDYSIAVPKIDRAFKNKIHSLDLDIVHIHSPFTIGYVGVEYSKKHKVPLIGTMHSQYKSDFKRAFKSKLITRRLTDKVIKIYDKCDLCYAVNYSTGLMYYKEYGYKCMPNIISNATEMTYLKNIDDSLDKMYSINEDEKVLLFVGRINELKNVFFIIDSLVELEKIGKLKYKMLFVGDGQDRKRLEEYVKKCNLTNKVIFCGKIIDREALRKHYRRADLFLFPSLYDASSIVQIEAASQKVPTLFLKDSVTSYSIIDNKNGYISERNPKGYAERIIEILNNKKLYNEVCENVYKDIYVSWDDTIEGLYNDYRSLLKQE